MANLQHLKNKVSDMVSSLSPGKKAELYYQERKQYIKLSMEGEHKKALNLLKRNNEFYEKYSYQDSQAFHKAHHKFIDWLSDYTDFLRFQDLLAGAKREQGLRDNELTIVKSILQLLILYQKSKDENSLQKLIETVELVVNKRNNELSEYPQIIIELESRVEENMIFKEHNYFQDVDPLGYKNMSWEQFMEVRGKMGDEKG